MTEKQLTDLLYNLDLESKELQLQRENLYSQLDKIESEINDREKKSNAIKLTLMKLWGGELNLDIKIDENLLLSDDELLQNRETNDNENLNDENKKGPLPSRRKRQVQKPLLSCQRGCLLVRRS